MKFPWFKHSVGEKALVLLKMGNWDQCIDSVERALGDNPSVAFPSLIAPPFIALPPNTHSFSPLLLIQQRH